MREVPIQFQFATGENVPFGIEEAAFLKRTSEEDGDCQPLKNRHRQI